MLYCHFAYGGLTLRVRMHGRDVANAVQTVGQGLAALILEANARQPENPSTLEEHIITFFSNNFELEAYVDNLLKQKTLWAQIERCAEFVIAMR